MGRLLRFALPIFNESRRRNYALVASAGSQAGERGEGTSKTCQAFKKTMKRREVISLCLSRIVLNVPLLAVGFSIHTDDVNPELSKNERETVACCFSGQKEQERETADGAYFLYSMMVPVGR